ncbi:tight adherence pilus pseudopilin TadF [Citrobacter sp. Cb028]|uniref:tight adherence pilus pseudopilin TadF n=1 Tax=Citrobacter sp. Cb028 TaxID=2985024 RepID=UPI002576A849|nr:tight adherence pilus pseudopilin TadF [Citrobacter sp. Cb028]MDM3453731.1 hypothetical protein [Citrobacter sp. Cb028]
MTTIGERLNCEKGSVAVEAAFVFLFFSGLFIYALQQTYVMVLSYSAEKTSAQVASLIAQRSTLFSNKNLQAKDIELLRHHIQALGESSKEFFDLYVEEVAYQTDAYQVIHIPSKDGTQCSLKKKLSAYSFNVQTSFAKNNGMYRVTVCRKISNMFYSDGDLVIGSSSVMPGHHH